MSITPQLALNALLFQLGWLLCALGGDRAAVLVAVIAPALHWLFISRERDEWLCIALSVAIGYTLDSALRWFGVLQFPGFVGFESAGSGWGVPLWLATIWLLFASTLNHSLRWLQTRRYWAAAAGALAAPLSYWAGVRFGVARFAVEPALALLVLAACWGLLLPLLSAMMKHRTRVGSLCKVG